MKKILFVDDEPNILSAYQRQLRKQYEVETALGGGAGLTVLQNWRDFGVVVADMRMPEMNGVEFLVKVRELAPDIVRIMLTGNADQTTAIEAINEGNIFRFLNKPCPPDKLTQALDAGLRQYELITAERDLLENTLSSSIKVLTEILAMSDPKLFGHSEALRDKLRQLARAINVDYSWQMEVAASLSQIGYITLPPEVALKARLGHTLTPREQELFTRIPSLGGNLIAQIPRLDEVAKIITYQNKRFDGAGYPEDKVAGDDIPLGARMLKLLADLAQLESKGTHRREALVQMRNRVGWYDPRLLDAADACFMPAPAGSTDHIKLPASVTFANLRVGHVLVSDIETKDGILIISAGNRITPPLIQRLRNFAALSGIKEPIHVEP